MIVCVLAGLRLIVKTFLELYEDSSDITDAPELQHGVVDTVGLQFDQLGELTRVQFADTAGYVVIEDEAQKLLLAVVEARKDGFRVRTDAIGAGDGGLVEGDVGQNVIQVTVLGLNQRADLGQLLGTVGFLLQPLQQLVAGIRPAPYGASLVFVLEERGQFTEQVAFRGQYTHLIQKSKLGSSCLERNGLTVMNLVYYPRKSPQSPSSC